MFIRHLKKLFDPDPFGDLLTGLGAGFQITRGVGDRIDCLVIAERAGPFVLQPDLQRGQITWLGEEPHLNGQPLDPALRARAIQDSDWLRERIHALLNLTIWVTPVVVFPNAQVQPGPFLQRVQLVDPEHLIPLLKMPRSANPAHAMLWESRAVLATL